MSKPTLVKIDIFNNKCEKLVHLVGFVIRKMNVRTYHLHCPLILREYLTLRFLLILDIYVHILTYKHLIIMNNAATRGFIVIPQYY